MVFLSQLTVTNLVFQSHTFNDLNQWKTPLLKKIAKLKQIHAATGGNFNGISARVIEEAGKRIWLFALNRTGTAPTQMALRLEALLQ